MTATSLSSLHMDILRPHIRLWRLCGIWSQPGDSRPYRIYSVVAFVVTSLLFNGSLLLHLVQHHSVDEAVECLLPATTTVMTSVKICIHLRNRQRFGALLGLLAELESRLDGDQTAARATSADARRRSRRLFVLITCSSCSAITLACVTALLQHRLMWPAWFPVAWEHSAGWYWALVGFQYVCNMYVGVVYTSMTTYAPILYVTLTAYLAMLGASASRIGADSQSRSTDALQLKQCYEQHRLCIEVGHRLNGVFGLQYAIHFCLSGLVICLTAFQLSADIQELSQFAFYCLYLFCMSVEIFLPCYFGSCLTLQSEQIGVQLYRCGWRQQSPRFAAAMRLVVQRSQRPIRMRTEQGLFAIQLSTFVAILRFAYSLLSCLKGQ